MFLRLLLSVLSLTPLAGCSFLSAQTALPPPPPSLATECPPLATPPDPLTDPARLEWEAGSITSYEECRARHREAIRAWTEAVKAVIQ